MTSAETAAESGLGLEILSYAEYLSDMLRSYFLSFDEPVFEDKVLDYVLDIGPFHMFFPGYINDPLFLAEVFPHLAGIEEAGLVITLVHNIVD